VRSGRATAPPALRTFMVGLWPLLQQTLAATIAWVIATRVLHHPEPFFAPISAVVALNAAMGERGANALRLLAGVVVGILAGEVAVHVLGSGYQALAIAVLVAMVVARAVDPARIVVAQAAGGAILTVATAQGEGGPQRLVDACIGAGVALVFSQLLFPPHPLALVRRAESAALADMASGLQLVAQALERGDGEMADRAVDTLRALRDRLGELARTRRASSRVVRHSLLWRSQKVPVVRENENAGHLDLLGGSCLTLARTAMSMRPDEREGLAADVRELAGAVADMAGAPGDRKVRQSAAERAAYVARRVASAVQAPSPSRAPRIALAMVAADVMVFAGVAPAEER
jgi:hypothetical protein